MRNKGHIQSSDKKDGFNFDEYADNYKDLASDRVRISGGSPDYFAEYKIIELTKRLPKIQIDNILDIGCGIGLSSPFFIKHFPEAHLFGIDVSAESINVAKQTDSSKNTNYQVYDGINFPFDKESFSIEFCSGVFHHIISDEIRNRVLSEAYRTLKKDGHLFIFEHNPKNLFTRIITNNPEDNAGKLVPIKEMLRLLSGHNFSCAEEFNTLFFPRHKALSWLLPLEAYLYKIPFGGQYYVLAKK